MIFLISNSKKTPSAAVFGRAGCITVHYLQFGCVLCIPFTITKTISMDVQGTFLNARMSNCPASNQSDRTEQKCWCRNQSGNVIRGPSQVPECSANRLWYRCRYADASGIILDPWQLYFWSLRTHLNRPHFHIVADFCWCSQMNFNFNWELRIRIRIQSGMAGMAEHPMTAKLRA